MEQEEYDDIFMYLKETKYSDGENDNDKRILRRKAKNFVYFWNSITKDVGDYLKCCEECQRKNKKTKTSVSEMTPVPVPERVWEKIAIYLIGSFLNSKKKPISENGYRTSYHHSTKFTPFYLMYLRQAVLPNETLDNYTENVGDEVKEKSTEHVISNLEVVRQEVTKKFKQNVQKAQKRQKEAYDRRHNVETKLYEIGQYVLLKKFRQKAGMATFEQRKYVGPNPESDSDDTTGDDEQDDQTDNTNISTELDEDNVDGGEAGGHDNDDSVFLTQKKIIDENDEKLDNNTLAINFNLSQSSMNSDVEVQQLMKDKDKEQAVSIDAYSKNEQNLDNKLSDIKREMKEFVRGEICKQARDQQRFEKSPTRKVDNLETNLKNENSESTERYNRLSTRIGNVELKHEKLENQISSNQNLIIGFLTHKREDMSYMKERFKNIPTQKPDDEDLNHDENCRRKKNLNGVYLLKKIMVMLNTNLQLNTLLLLVEVTKYI
ncbi:unnamed protein product [Mytilus coruscus]|uniref:Integrase zinc-binding domain-containing protein n=1 Tax=Mytilus coruscus TaxID=42192 RepID=A0A6J8CB13_MYTCO|nr:unnamed protein product [Mytilus coruscus]